MANRYETVFIMTPVLSDQQTKEAAGKFTELIKNSGAKIMNEEDWGLRKLAYPIQKETTGFYHLVEFEGEGAIIEKLEIEFKRDERIIRFLTVKLDKHSIAYAEKRKALRKTAKSQPKEEEKPDTKSEVQDTKSEAKDTKSEAKDTESEAKKEDKTEQATS